MGRGYGTYGQGAAQRPALLAVLEQGGPAGAWHGAADGRGGEELSGEHVCGDGVPPAQAVCDGHCGLVAAREEGLPGVQEDVLHVRLRGLRQHQQRDGGAHRM